MSKYLGRVVVYSIVGCPHCKSAKHSLSEKGIPYVEVSVDKYQSGVRQQLQQRTGKSTVPQIFVNDRFIGGNDDLQKLMSKEEEWAKVLTLLETTVPSEDDPALPDNELLLAEDASTTDGGDFVCEPDEYATLVQELKTADIIGDHRKGIFNQKRTFTGKDFVRWLVSAKDYDEQTALSKGEYLIQHHFVHPVKHSSTFGNDDELYRLVADEDSQALNQGDVSQCEVTSANQLGEDLRKLILKIYNGFLSDDGKRVDYKGIAESDLFQQYQSMTLQLQRVHIEAASCEEKLAFFINVYNALVIHANVVRGPPQNLWQRYKFFNTVKYIIGGHSYSLQDIENGVLRANRKGVGMLFRPFGSNDPRLKVALGDHEPLIHFALVCGAKSCPPIKTYSADGIMDQLKTAAQSFMEGEDVSVDADKKTISISRIFSWYKEDFGGNDKMLLAWIVNNMADGEKHKQLEELVNSNQWRLSFLPYDWSTNS